MAYIRIEDYDCFKDYIHPHINDCIDHYRHKDIIHLPAYHGCNTVNRNGTRKPVDYRRGLSAFVQQIKDIGGKQKQNTE